MPRHTALFVMLAAALIAATSGCSPAQDSGKEPRTEAEKQQALRDSSFGPMVETMDRARGVEQLEQDRKNELDAAIEQAGDQ